MFLAGIGDNLHTIGVKGKVILTLKKEHLPESISIVQAEQMAKDYADSLLAEDGYKLAVHVFSLKPLAYCLALYVDEKKLPDEWWEIPTAEITLLEI